MALALPECLRGMQNHDAVSLCGGVWLLGRFMNAPTARWQMIGLIYVAFLAITPFHRQSPADCDRWRRQALAGDGWPLRPMGIAAFLAKYASSAVAGSGAGTSAGSPFGIGGRGGPLRPSYFPARDRRHRTAPTQTGARSRCRGRGAGFSGAAVPGCRRHDRRIDHDVVDNSNLQRQVIHRDEMLGKPKVFSAKRRWRKPMSPCGPTTGPSPRRWWMGCSRIMTLFWMAA